MAAPAVEPWGLRGLGPRAGIAAPAKPPKGRQARRTSAWAYVVSNHGPLPCEGSALPLSYTPWRRMKLTTSLRWVGLGGRQRRPNKTGAGGAAERCGAPDATCPL